MRAVRLAILIPFVLCVTAPGRAQSLRGSPASLTRQYEQAKRHDYTFLRQPADVQRFVDLGLLVPVRPGPAYDLARVSFPYARPEVKLFLERLGRQYQAACGEKLVVTSLVRPTTRQPRNAADRSVHPTGMAMDLRRSNKASCRRWLERVLLQLEARGVLEATRENRPPHYHVALFPRPYVQYVAALTGESVQGLLASVTEPRDAMRRAPSRRPRKRKRRKRRLRSRWRTTRQGRAGRTPPRRRGRSWSTACRGGTASG